MQVNYESLTSAQLEQLPFEEWEKMPQLLRAQLAQRVADWIAKDCERQEALAWQEWRDEVTLAELREAVQASTDAFERDWVRPLTEHGYSHEHALRMLCAALFQKPN